MTERSKSQTMTKSYVRKPGPAKGYVPRVAPGDWDFRTARHGWEKAFIIAALKAHNWSLVNTADAMGITTRALHYQMKAKELL